jgi:hypothetical protein
MVPVRQPRLAAQLVEKLAAFPSALAPRPVAVAAFERLPAAERGRGEAARLALATTVEKRPGPVVRAVPSD